ncbi:restriction endonuclease subunit S [Enterococcus faecium]|uniref:restriction endonuclease subunit S n=1 Tax=Enterococcus faecium TaxID=1352 RepID=UPI0025AEF94E|nr:restriction endonuclease subunit S [Enterococcus faecium]MDN3052535.1 restriction endonuclease subunit S [Enterococcus faecium]
MSNDTQPEIRFPGFTEDWEQRELSDISTKVQTKNKDREFTETLTNSAEFGIISQNDFFDKEISNKNNIDGYYVVKPNDFVYNPRISNFAPVGPIKRNKLGRTGVMSPLYYVFSTNNIDNQYLETYFSTSYWHKFMKLNGDSGARADRFAIRDSVFVKMPIPYPSREEQEKIGQFFEVLSNAIDLQQRKLDLLKETKKGFLQKMFPKNGAKVPEIRFPGFTEAWEQRKLGQVANYRRGSFPQPYGNKEWYDGENSMPFVQVVDVGDNLRLVEDTKQKISELAQPKSVFVEEGKVVVTLQGSIGRVAITQYPAYVDRTLLIFESYKAEMDEYYFAYVIQQLFEYEKTRAPGGTIKTITKEALSNFTISFPSIAEQKKLGKFFEQLDDTIALHQRKLDLLKETKKGFLQKMFV